MSLDQGGREGAGGVLTGDLRGGRERGGGMRMLPVNQSTITTNNHNHNHNQPSTSTNYLPPRRTLRTPRGHPPRHPHSCRCQIQTRATSLHKGPEQRLTTNRAVVAVVVVGRGGGWMRRDVVVVSMSMSALCPPRRPSSTMKAQRQG